MQNAHKTVFFARNMTDVLAHLASVPDLSLTAGCTLIRELPPVSMNIRSIPDLQLIDRRERYVELGSAVTLARVLGIGKKHLPTVFYDSVQTTSTPFVRNLATIGGNLCSPHIRRSLFAPLLALDAQFDFMGEKAILTMPINKFDKVPPEMILTKIRIPVDEWEIGIFRRLGPACIFTDKSAFFVFLAMTQKNILSDVRIAYCGKKTYRNRAIESAMIGTKLPLSQKAIQTMLETAKRIFDSKDEGEIGGESDSSPFDSPLAESQYLNLLKNSLEELT